MAQASVGQVRDDAEASPGRSPFSEGASRHIVDLFVLLVCGTASASALHPFSCCAANPRIFLTAVPGSTELLFPCCVLLLEALLQKELEQIDARAGLGMGSDGTKRAHGRQLDLLGSRAGVAARIARLAASPTRPSVAIAMLMRAGTSGTRVAGQSHADNSAQPSSGSKSCTLYTAESVLFTA